MILYVAWSNILVSSVCHSSVASTRAKPTGFLARLAAIFLDFTNAQAFFVSACEQATSRNI